MFELDQLRKQMQRRRLSTTALAVVFCMGQSPQGLAAIINTVTVTGNNGSVVLTATDTEIVDVVDAAPSLLVVKTETFNDEDNSLTASVGDTIDYAITVTNNGNVTINGGSLTDVTTQGANSVSLDNAPALISGDADDPGNLNVGETWTYAATLTLTAAMIADGGDIENTATFNGVGGGVPVEGDDDAVTPLDVQGPTPSLSGTVFSDLDSNGVFSYGDRGEPGYIVQLVQNGAIIDTLISDQNGNYLFEEFAPGTYDVVFIDPANGVAVGAIEDVVVGVDAVVVDHDLPIDPSGVIYDAVTGMPVAGAVVTLTTANGTPLPDECLLTNQQGQVTGADGQYRFDIRVGASPLCPTADTEYQLSIVSPTGYLPGTSQIIPPQAGILDADNCSLDTTPGGSCSLSSSPDAPDPLSPTPYFMAFEIGSGDPHIIHNHVPLDPVPVIGVGDLVMTKTASQTSVSIGETLNYTLSVTNTSSTDHGPVDMVDVLPPGFAYLPNSAVLDGTPTEPTIAGRRLTFDNVMIASGDDITVTMTVRVGTGVSPGEHVNLVSMVNPLTGDTVSNVASATVRLEADPVFDCGEIIGKVFDDRNNDGNQDPDEPGLPGVRLATVKGILITTDQYGRYSVPCAALPDEDIGSNFILKLDTRTLPTGYRITTENPRVVRLTPGKLTKLNFGASISRVVDITLTNDAFLGFSLQFTSELDDGIDGLIDTLVKAPVLLRLTYRADAGDRALARNRLEAVEAELRKRFRERGVQQKLTIENVVVNR